MLDSGGNTMIKPTLTSLTAELNDATRTIEVLKALVDPQAVTIAALQKELADA
jgi:predicted transcriptional regulator